jgi:hypothetical protein
MNESSPLQEYRRSWRLEIVSVVTLSLVAFWLSPQNATHSQSEGFVATDLTLRKVLLEAAETDDGGFHLAMAPAFFGFYGYFGALSAWEEAVDPQIFQSGLPRQRVRSVAGASAGAMAAILLASGVSPSEAAEFCSHNITISKFADFPALGAFFRGRLFQQTMHEFVRQKLPHQSLLLEDAVLPVAVSAFDLQTLQGQILTRGSLARAARASACFPFLFQPVGWQRDDVDQTYTLIDGAIGDPYGWNGLLGFVNNNQTAAKQRIVHMQMGSFHPPGPSQFLAAYGSSSSSKNTAEQQHHPSVEVISISIHNLPQCGPWALDRGPIAVGAARQAMIASLDEPLLLRKGGEEHHYELHIYTASFWGRQ